MPDLRQLKIVNWLQKQFPNEKITIKPASNDASFRRYFRILIKNTSYIIMDAPPEKEKIKPFVDIAQLMLTHGTNVPRIIAQDLNQGFLLLNDFGHTQYLQVLNDETVDNLYDDALNALQKIQINIPVTGLPNYCEEKLKQEMDLFKDWFVTKHCHITLTNKQNQILEKTWNLLTNNALEQPQCFVHRDYHSRNLMLTENNNPGIIDFQDAIKGAITYDLASLLKDCYIRWDKLRIEVWVESYRQKLLNNGVDLPDKTQFLKWFDLMGLQRHIKILGIFCRLNYRDNKKNYLNDLPLTYQYALETAEQYPELNSFAQLLKGLSFK